MKEKCPLCGNDKEPTGMQLLCHPPITEVACRKCQPGKFSYISFDVKRHDEAALKQSVWDGTGLPPVGCHCEIYNRSEWFAVKIKFIGDKWIVAEPLEGMNEDCCENQLHGEDCYSIADKPHAFRPLRTEAERAIDEMVQLSGVSTGAAKILYDAGYRK